MDATSQGLRDAAGTQRAFLYQRRLVALRPFVTDDGVPGLNLRFAGGETIAVRIDVQLLELVHLAIERLRARPICRRLPNSEPPRAG